MEIPKECSFLIKQVKGLLIAIAGFLASLLIFQNPHFLVQFLKYLLLLVSGSASLGFISMILSTLFYIKDDKIIQPNNSKPLSFLFGTILPIIIGVILYTYDVKVVWAVVIIGIFFSLVTIGISTERD